MKIRNELQEGTRLLKLLPLLLAALLPSISFSQDDGEYALTSDSDTSPSRDTFNSVCKSGRQIKKIEEHFGRTVFDAQPGTPIDAAVKYRKDQLGEIRSEAKTYFINDPGMLSYLESNYTMFIPPKLQAQLGVGCRHRPCGFNQDNETPSPSLALSDMEQLWKTYILKFTSIKETPSDEPSHYDFEVTIDLELFCKYGRRASSLVVHEFVPDSERNLCSVIEGKITNCKTDSIPLRRQQTLDDGMAAYKDDRFQAAQSYFTMYLSTDGAPVGEQIEAIYFRAESSFNMGEFEEAQRDYKLFLNAIDQFDPNKKEISDEFNSRREKIEKKRLPVISTKAAKTQ